MMQESHRSTKIRNYAIAGFFIILTLLMIVSAANIFSYGDFGSIAANIWSECRNDAAYVFIGANEDLKDVKCVLIDKGYAQNQEVVIGDLSKNNEDVCRFKLAKNTTEPLRFEVGYNKEVKREVCEWQHYITPTD